MELIDKAAVVAEIEKRIEICAKQREDMLNVQCHTLADDASARMGELNCIQDFIDTLEVKDMSMPALDNGNMPIERWKEACEAASCQANYRKSKGWTETCDDYFVDGVQWADEHPIKMKEVDLKKELDKFYGMYRKDGQTFSLEDNEECVDWKVDCNPEFEKSFARHFVEIGISVSNKAQKGE